MKRAELIATAKVNAAKDAQARGSQVFQRVIGAFGQTGLLRNNIGIGSKRAEITLEDVSWAGEEEPRILEVLPAVLIKKPAFVTVTTLPSDLKGVLEQLRRNELPNIFRGVPGDKLMEWLPRVGHKNKQPSRSQTSQ